MILSVPCQKQLATNIEDSQVELAFGGFETQYIVTIDYSNYWRNIKRQNNSPSSSVTGPIGS